MKRRTQTWGAVGLSAAMALGLAAGPAAAKTHKPKPPPNRFYTQTNSPAGNAIKVFNRAKDGTLKPGKTYATGSFGSGSLRPATPFPFTESTSAVTLSHNGRLLFAVNHGGNTITSFRVTQAGLKRVSTTPSGGAGPLSVAVSPNDKLVYVVNEAKPATIFGFTVNSKGVLKPMGDSTRTLAYPGGFPGQIRFSPSGKVLVVTDREAGPGEEQDFIESFTVRKSGRVTARPPTPATGQTPFGFTFTKSGALVVTYPDNDRIGLSSVGSYTTSDNGTLTPADLEATNASATCWVVETRDQKFVFVSNTLSLGLSTFAVAEDAKLTPVNLDSARTGGAPTELALSHDGKFLYVLNVDVGVVTNDPNARTDVDIFRVGSGATLTKVGTGAQGLPTTTSGGIAW
jgi:6-phosphogluconolactonase (cycloisomerase 2 family)